MATNRKHGMVRVRVPGARRKISDETVRLVRADKLAGLTNDQIAAKYGISSSSVSDIVRRESDAKLSDFILKPGAEQ